jgi:tetratricopeptide (TPR) repeat protein
MGYASETGFWAPSGPPRATYTIDCRIDPAKGSLEGIETVSLSNNSSRPIHRLALDWSLNGEQTAEIAANGRSVSLLAGQGQRHLSSPILFELPEALPPGGRIELNVNFRKSLSKQDRIVLTGWHPRLWWGFRTHDDFGVRIQAPSEYAIGASGRLDAASGYYHIEGAASFGLFLGKGLQVIESNADGVLVRCLHTSKAEECVRLILATAVDAIKFYRQRSGFYPYASLTIIPGMDRPAGGYPVATGMVAIHGQERMSECSELHWKWITAHEIGHQYWGEYVLEKDTPGWLWIGLGIYADREYVRARNLGSEKHRGLMARYMEGVRQHLDTTIGITSEQFDDIDFDFNNVVIHGKGYSIISALACLLGQDTFDRIYGRCLKEFAGRRLSAYEFQAVCEEESRQDLGWFFDQWVRSSRYLSYQIASEKCNKQDDVYVSEVEVDCLGTLKMPVPVMACFEDGTSQQKFTDRLINTNILRFESSAPLEEARLDPDGELALIVPPPTPASKDLDSKLRDVPWTGGGKQALDLFNEAREIKPADADFWGILGLKVYDGKYYAEALDAFRQSAELAGEGSLWGFASTVWQGHILDLLGRRAEAIQCYKEAQKRYRGGSMQHAQYDMHINPQWVKERLEKPFERK